MRTWITAKRVHDAHGHLVGAAVLRDVTQRSRSAVRSSDAVGRYGGEESLARSAGRHRVARTEA